MKDYKPPYSIIGISLDRRELQDLKHECVRADSERAVVIKKALKYWLTLDAQVKDGV
jgi:hypothetical protein